MTKQVIAIGTIANDGTGDPIRTAFDKVNQNFTELFKQAGTVISAVTAPSVIPNIDNVNYVEITALAENLSIVNPVGTPLNKQKLAFEIKDDGTIRNLTFDTEYVSGGVSLPAATQAGKTLTLGFVYTTANALNKWRLLAVLNE